jgi:YihY family inner membrane protein
MNPVETAIRAIDRAQRRLVPTAFAFGVIKKYGDDNGGVLVSNLAYSAFVSLFPLLLILTTILGLIASADAAVRTDVLNAVARQVPMIGKTLTENVHVLRRSSIIGLIIGFVGLVWGATGLAQAGLFAMEQVWNLPGPSRPGFFPRLIRALIFLIMLGIGVTVTTGLASLNTFGHKAAVFVILAEIAAALVNIGLYSAAFRVLTPKGVPMRDLLPGAITGGIAWTILQVLGTYLLHHYLSGDSVYGIFATVLGLLAWIFLVAEITIYSAEINVVLARRIWPRAIVQPPLTEGDRISMALQALQNQRRPEQDIEVTFSDREPDSGEEPRAPRTPAEVVPPARPRRRRGGRGTDRNGTDRNDADRDGTGADTGAARD